MNHYYDIHLIQNSQFIFISHMQIICLNNNAILIMEGKKKMNASLKIKRFVFFFLEHNK